MDEQTVAQDEFAIVELEPRQATAPDNFIFVGFGGSGGSGGFRGSGGGSGT